jgi:predicted ATPase/DNA-binding winged helix-turn-helix (wHTH) protein
MNTGLPISRRAATPVEPQVAPACARTQTIQFGRFRLAPHRRELLADGVLVPIGGRALDVLMVLIEARGKLVTKDEFLDRVWGGTIVEENTLQFQISTLRKVLGDDHGFIKTVSGRGYCFVADVTTQAAQPSAAAFDAAPVADLSSAGNLPVMASDLAGRQQQLAELVDVAESHRMVTLTGPGGVGKTRLGVALARQLQPLYPDGVWLVELGSLTDPHQVLPSIAGALGLADPPATQEHLATALATKRLLLLLDNCEHVIGAAARVAEALLHAGASLHVIATSRERLRADGEFVYPVPPLDVPAPDATDGAELLCHSAVQLFIDRARAGGLALSPDARLAAVIATICRRLDGIPLAIELAATGAAALGVDGLAARLDEWLGQPGAGRRTATLRQRSLRASFDWSYGSLSEDERRVLRRLAIFPGLFTLQAAEAVAGDPDGNEDDVTATVLGLVAKSLVIAELNGKEPRYRLLDTTRVYALEKLRGSGDAQAVFRRHADYARGRWERFPRQKGTRSAADPLVTGADDTDDMRAALEWAFLSGADPSTAAVLTAA